MNSISMRAAPLHAAPQSRYDMSSPLLFGLMAALPEEGRLDVLDVAPASAGVIDYFACRHCKLYLPACRDALCRLSGEAETIPRRLKRLLPFRAQDDTALDLVLLWDLPNYLQREVQQSLIQYLLPYLSRDAVLHVYIHTREHMPQQPGRFSLTAQATVSVDLSAPWTTPSPMYYRELLHKLLDPFRVERGVLLANGLQEYILRIN